MGSIDRSAYNWLSLVGTNGEQVAVKMLVYMESAYLTETMCRQIMMPHEARLKRIIGLMESLDEEERT